MRSKKLLHNTFFPVAAALCLLVSCDLPPAAGGRGVLAVVLPGTMSGAVSDARKLLSEDFIKGLDDMELQYRIDCTGPGKTQSVSAQPGQTATVYLEPGSWRIAVTALQKRYGDYQGGQTGPTDPDREYIVWKPVGHGDVSTVILPGQEKRLEIPLLLDDDFDPVEIWGSEWITAPGDIGFDDPNSFEVYDNNANWLFNPGFESAYQWYISTNKSNRGGAPLKDDDFVVGADSPNLQIELGFLETTTYLYCEVTYSLDDAVFTRRTKPWGVYSGDFDGLKRKINDDDNPEWTTISLPQGVNFYVTETITVNKGITLFGCMNNFYRGTVKDVLFSGEMFNITNGLLYLSAEGGDGTLVLWGVPYVGSNDVVSLTEPLIKVGRFGTLEMNDSVRLYENRAANGGAVYVGAGGSFNMNGGDIYGNKADTNGGAVYVAADGIFSMANGDITGNSAGEKGGGVYVDSGGSFYKWADEWNNGTITGSDNTDGNTTKEGSNGLAVFYAGENWWRDTTVDSDVQLTTASPENWNE